MRRAVAGIGRALVTVGLLILLFVGYQLWGTGVLQARAQSDLEGELAALQADVTPPSTTPPDQLDPAMEGAAETGPVTLPAIAPGDPLGRIRIPDASVDEIFVAGVSRSDLQKGPGHYPSTPMPGQVGNAAIAGHRTTYGAPFFDLDDLEPGDWIVTDTLLGTHVYLVQWSEVVEPTQVEVVGPVAEDPDGSYLTLTTCNPKYSARERLVVRAKLLDPGAVTPPGAPDDIDGAVTSVELSGGGATLAEQAAFSGSDALSFESGLDTDAASLAPTYLWGAALVVVGLGWWWAFRRWRLPVTWIVGVVPFLVVLTGFYVNLERVLPSGY